MNCYNCGGKSQFYCGKCLTISYCSQKCAKQDWGKSHRFQCIEGNNKRERDIEIDTIQKASNRGDLIAVMALLQERDTGPINDYIGYQDNWTRFPNEDSWFEHVAKIGKIPNYNLAFLQACKKGYFAIVRLLLQDGRVDLDNKYYLDPNVRSDRLSMAGFFKALPHVDILQLLYPIANPPEASIRAMIKSAIVDSQFETVRHLLQYNPPLDGEVVLRAVKKNNASILRGLLKNEIDNYNLYVNAISKESLKHNNPEVLLALLDDGRLDWRYLKNTKVFQLWSDLKFADHLNRLKTIMDSLAEKGFPQDIQKKIAYEAEYLHLCEYLSNRIIAPVLLFRLAKMLNVQMTGRENQEFLCEKLRRKLNELF